MEPDRCALTRQREIDTYADKGCGSRCAGVKIPKYEDTEVTMADVLARIDKTIAYVKTFKPEQIDGSEEKAITIKTPTREMNFNGQQFLLNLALPNLFFHITTTYNILRHNGVEVGKMDYLGA